MGTNTLNQLLSRKQPVGFNHSSFAMDPLRLNWVEPGTLRRQTKRQDADALALSFHLRVVFAYPGAHDLADCARRHYPRSATKPFALGHQASQPHSQKLRGDSR